MASITETKNRLPKEFVENIYEMFSPGVVDGIFISNVVGSNAFASINLIMPVIKPNNNSIIIFHHHL